MQSYKTAKYNLNHFFNQYQNFFITFIFSLLSIGMYKMAIVVK